MGAWTPRPCPARARSHPREPGPASARDTSPWLHRLWRGPDTDPAWARPTLLGLLFATALLYVYNLTSSGWANAFYSAAVQAGSESWEAFFFGSSDAGNSITVDKPPAALWVMALSVRLLGLSSFAILLPEVLMGVATVGVLYATVRRHFGPAAGLVAGAAMALTPVAVLMFRFNNPDALLTLLMALGAWATMRSIEQGSAKWFAIVGVFVGLGFLTKALQVLLVVPAFGLAYLLFANTTLRRRITGALMGTAAMVLSAGWWVAVVELVPASMRPYIGGSQDNSFLSVTLGYNGLGRINGNETGSVGGGNGWGETGLTRMFSSQIGGQISWLIPSALILLAVGLYLRGRRPRTDARRAAYVVWGGWLLVTMATFSLMAGIFHEYYTVALAPAVGALVGMGAQEAWERRERAVGSVTLAAATAAAATWSFILLSRVDWLPWLRVGILALGMASALLLLAITQLHRRWVPAVLAGVLVAALAGPRHTACPPSPRATPAPSSRRDRPWPVAEAVCRAVPCRPPPAAPRGPGPAGWGRRPGRAPRCRHAEHGGRLGSQRRRRGVHLGGRGHRLPERRRTAAGHRAPGHGDRRLQRQRPSPTLAQFQDYVDAGQIHFFAVGGGRGMRGPGGLAAAARSRPGFRRTSRP